MVIAKEVSAKGKSKQALPPKASWPRTRGREGGREGRKNREMSDR